MADVPQMIVALQLERLSVSRPDHVRSCIASETCRSIESAPGTGPKEECVVPEVSVRSPRLATGAVDAIAGKTRRPRGALCEVLWEISR